MRSNRVIVTIFLALVGLLVGSQPAWSQATVATGGIQGSVNDPQGGAVAGAKVTITGKAQGKTAETATDASGLYSTGLLTPGVYTVRVVAQGFKTTELAVTVQVGVIATGNVQLELGSASAVVEVTTSAVTVNTEQAQVQGVVTQDQIENLPINGRNFLDLAQLEPGVQIQDGADFDPTKTGFSSISFGGRFGRTARIEVDGADVSDETVGTTTTDIPSSAIAEFQLAQSSLDMSNELTSSGSVNVVTRSGTNEWHGEGYGAFRDSSEGAALPGLGATYQRNQEGGNVGGAIIKDKLFFFADGERTLQHAGAGLSPADPFTSFAGSFSSPFKEGTLLGKVDWQATKTLHIFYRYDYFSNFLVPAFGTPSYEDFLNKDITRVHVLGADWTTGAYTHSVRFQYLKFQNQIGNATSNTSPFGTFPVALDFLSSSLATGASPDAPQATPQSSHQLKYDGSRVWNNHIFRYGIDYNHIHGGGFASFFQFAPLVLSFQIPGFSFDPAAALTCPGGQTGMSCPLNYLPDEALIGNGQGYSTSQPAFGRPFGGLGPDNRIGLYLGDSWKIYPNFTLTYGVRYDRDTGRTDSDLAAIPALNAVLPGFGNPVNQPDTNLAPQLGFAWDPGKSGKTVIRAGIGLYFDNAIFNNVLFDRSPRLSTQTGFFAQGTPCDFGSAEPVSFGDGTVQTIPGGAATCTTAVGLPVPASAVGPTCPAGTIVAQCIDNFQLAYAASFAANPIGPNPNSVPTQIAEGLPIAPSGIFAPNYKSPRSVQMNIGFQREIAKGTVLTVDYLRNVGTHFLLTIDENHTGDAAFLNQPAALNAINEVNADFGCGAITPLGTPGGNTAGITCAMNSPVLSTCQTNAAGTAFVPGAQLCDYANAGLDGPRDLGVGACNGPNGSRATASGTVFSGPCAFGGINPNIGPAFFLEPVGSSLYNGLDVKLTKNAHNPLPGIKYLNGQIAYTFSRFDYDGSSNGLGNPGTPANDDQDFIDQTLDNRNPRRFWGPQLLDRTNQLNFGGYADLPAGFRMGVTAHFWSPLAVTPFTDVQAGPGAIFQADFTGSGLVNDPLPLAETDPTCGTMGGNCNYSTLKSGAFMRQVGPTGLANDINTFNSSIAGKTITPAGQALVNAGLITEAQLIALNATPQSIAPAATNAVGLSWLKATDMQLSWVGHVGERLTIQPNVGFFNVFNFGNYDATSNTQSGSLNGSAGSVGYTTGANRTNKTGTGTGVFSLGAPRAIEWGLKFTF
jgi:hypothetical protein